MVIELDEHDCTLNPIVERAHIIAATDPAEVRVRDMPLDLLHSRSIGCGRKWCDVSRGEIQQMTLLQR